jgi:transcriptional regulator GlxA family with amidase domain
VLVLAVLSRRGVWGSIGDIDNLHVIPANVAMTRIQILAYDGCLGGEVFGFADVLMFANRRLQMDGRPAAFQVDVVTLSGEPARTIGGATLGPTAAAGPCDLLVVPGWDLPRRSVYPKAMAALRPEADHVAATVANGGRAASICVGAFLLGEAGVLDGRRVTTAWAYAERLARTYPRARVQPRALVLEDGPVTTSGAFSAALDLGLSEVRRGAGEAVARWVMRLALLEGGRTSQAAFADDSLSPDGGGEFSRTVAAFMKARLKQPYDLEALAGAFNMSSRTLLRRFKAETGRTPLHVLQAARLEKAKALLADTRLAVSEITAQVGYEDVSSFHTLFAARVGETPAGYRRRFQA